MTIHDLPLQYARLLNHLRDHGPASTKEIENTCAIMHPSTIVSRIRAIYGNDTITGQWRTGRNKFGEKTKFMVYTLTKEGRARVWPIRKTFPAWINTIQIR